MQPFSAFFMLTLYENRNQIAYFFMENMDRVRKEIEEYIFENGREYQRLLMSKTFHNKLQKEAEKHNSKVDLPNLEIKENANYDFKLLP